MIEKFIPSIRSKIEKLNKVLQENYQCSVDLDAPKEVLQILKSRCATDNKSIALSESNVHLNTKYTRNLLISEVASLILNEQTRLNERKEKLTKLSTHLLYTILESLENNIEPDEAFTEAMEALKEFDNDFEEDELEEAMLDEVGNWDPISDNQAKNAAKLQNWLRTQRKPPLNEPEMKLEPIQGQSSTQKQNNPGEMNLSQRGQTQLSKTAPINPHGEMNLDPKKKDPFDNEWKRKLAALRIGNSSPLANATIESNQNFVKNLRQLLESEVNEAEVLIAAKGFSQELQTIIEKLGRLQNEDLGPVADRMKEVYGEQVGMEFYEKVNGEFQNLLDSMKTTRDNITGIIMGMAQGQMGMMNNDMANDNLGDLNTSEDLPDDLSTEPGMEDDFAGADVAAGPEEEPLGRAKK